MVNRGSGKSRCWWMVWRMTVGLATPSAETGLSGWDLLSRDDRFMRWGTRQGELVTLSRASDFAEIEVEATAEEVLTAVMGESFAAGPGMQSFVTNELLVEEVIADVDSGVSYVVYRTINGEAQGVVAVWRDEAGWVVAFGEQGGESGADVAGLVGFVLTRPSWVVDR